jgi:flagellar hook-basal body complex protein FliE
MNELTISNLESNFAVKDGIRQKETDASDTPFSDYVKRSLEGANRQMLDADQAIGDLASGANQDIHNTMIAMRKAEISFELVMQIRNKLINAYDEVRRMSI